MNLTKEEQELINKFDEYYLEKEEIINNTVGLSKDSFIEFLLSEIRTAVERERKKFIELIEKQSDNYKDNRPSYGINNRTMLERRWQAIKVILHGISTDKENREALNIVEVLMDKTGEKDTYLLNKLVPMIQKYEKKYDSLK